MYSPPPYHPPPALQILLLHTAHPGTEYQMGQKIPPTPTVLKHVEMRPKEKISRQHLGNGLGGHVVVVAHSTVSQISHAHFVFAAHSLLGSLPASPGSDVTSLIWREALATSRRRRGPCNTGHPAPPPPT